MLKKPLYILLALAVTTLLVFGCRRENGINNNQVIKTPYSLYISDTSGALFNTNDGKNIKRIFPPDGKPCRALCVSGPNIIMVKDKTYYSTNGGQNFNLSLADSTRSDTYVDTTLVCYRYYGRMNQSMILDIPQWNEVYLAANPAYSTNVSVGLVFSLNKNGAFHSWTLSRADTLFQHIGTVPVFLNSLTRMKNGVVVGYSYLENRTFFAWDKEYNFDGWRESTGNSAGDAGIGDPERQSGIRLPSATDSFTIGHLNNRLIAGPVGCSGTIYYSDDTGRNWIAYAGGVANAPVLCIASPFEQVALIGTHGKGLYILNTLTGMWQPNINGLPGDLVVRNIAAKEQTFKNGNTEQYIYLATNKGIYQSRDKGFNWVLTIPGNFTCVY